MVDTIVTAWGRGAGSRCLTHRLIVEPERLHATLPLSVAGRLRTHGVYCIVGGAGGLGQIFARHLASRYSARLLLTGRSPAGPRDEPAGGTPEGAAVTPTVVPAAALPVAAEVEKVVSPNEPRCEKAAVVSCCEPGTCDVAVAPTMSTWPRCHW